MKMNTRLSIRLSIALTALLLMTACGGGGSGATSTAEPTVTALSTGTAKYSDTLLVTLTGSNLDAGLTVASPGCKAMTRSTTAPNVSDASTAYYSCTASAIGTQTVTATRTSDGAVLQSANFTIAVPQVTMTLNNGMVSSGGALRSSAVTYSNTMVFELAPDKAPITVDNFLRYVKDGFYNGIIFHRSVSNFVVQAGSIRINSERKVFGAIPLEVNKGLSNVQWSVAMARTADPNTATSEFFINLVDNRASLDPSAPDRAGYAVFGNVVSGSEAATAIVTAPCTRFSDIPLFGDTECTPNPLMVITSAVQTR
jgi:peptidyl-prolyl cis-trans isomerase A (cyclophilin A)